MIKRTLISSNDMTPKKARLGVLSSVVLLLPFLMAGGCNEPAASKTETVNPNNQSADTASIDQFESIAPIDEGRFKFSDDAIQVGLPVEIAAFKTGLNSDLAQTACGDCHSTDYPTTQPLFTRTQWKATIAKMHDKFGAPWGDIFGTLAADGITIIPADAATIAANLQKIEDYLVVNYGKGL